MDKAIKCSTCGNYIYLDDTIWYKDDDQQKFCSAICFAYHYASKEKLTIEKVNKDELCSPEYLWFDEE